MGIMDMFQRGGKYFGKEIEPHCEYCDFGKRAKDGNKVLCDKRGLVDADFHCGKFTYSPLKRIPVKQLNRVGFLDDDEEFNDNEEETQTAEAEKLAAKTVPPLEEPASAPKPAETTAEAPDQVKETEKEPAAKA